MITATEAELGWLAGMLEGEGSITFFEQPRKNGSFDIITGLNITNTDLIVINKIMDITNKCGLSWFLRTKKIYSKKHSDCYFVECRQQGMLKKSLEILIPFMYGKKKSKAELVVRFLDKRFERTGGRKCGNIPYNNDELSLIPRGHMSSSRADEDMVHTT